MQRLTTYNLITVITPNGWLDELLIYDVIELLNTIPCWKARGHAEMQEVLMNQSLMVKAIAYESEGPLAVDNSRPVGLMLVYWLEGERIFDGVQLLHGESLFSLTKELLRNEFIADDTLQEVVSYVEPSNKACRTWLIALGFSFKGFAINRKRRYTLERMV